MYFPPKHAVSTKPGSCSGQGDDCWHMSDSGLISYDFVLLLLHSIFFGYLTDALPVISISCSMHNRGPLGKRGILGKRHFWVGTDETNAWPGLSVGWLFLLSLQTLLQWILSCPALPQTYSAPCISMLYVSSLLMKNTVLCFCRDQRELSACKWRSNIKKTYLVLDRSTAFEQIHAIWKKRLLFNIAALF